MNKCHELTGYKELSVALVRDLHGFLPTDNQECLRDIKRMHSLVENRGIGFLTLTLPEAGRIFDQALASGRLNKLSLPGFAPIGGKVSAIIPRFFRGAWLRVFDNHGLLLEDPDIVAIACLRQLFACFKKVRMNCDPIRIADTVRDFYQVEQSLRLPSHLWDDGHIDDRAGSHLHIGDGLVQLDGAQQDLPDFTSQAPYCDPSILECVQQCSDALVSAFGDFNPEEWRPKHGPGAVSDGKVGRFLKFAFPSWSDRLETVFPLSQFGFPNYDAWVRWLAGDPDYPEGSFSSLEVPSRLITVPKTMKGPRLIASEPTSNQYCQQTILQFIVSELPMTPFSKAITFHTQEPNRVAALEGSKHGHLATIDLSSASDCVSCWLVERIFRRNRPLLRALVASRTSWLRDEVSSPPIFHYLRKFTTMGAATTFPIQTLIYACIAAGVMLHKTGLAPTRKNLEDVLSCVRVFGDDIIIPVGYARSLIEVLTYLGFRVNQAKTFHEGNFRESCGMDAYAGVDVTPAYILGIYDESRPSSIESVRACSNNLFIKGMWNTAAALEKTLPAGVSSKLPVVGVESGFPGRVSFCGSMKDHLKKRWSNQLHRFEYRCVGVKAPARRISPGGSASLLQYFLEAPSPETMQAWQSGYDERPGTVVSVRWVSEDELS